MRTIMLILMPVMIAACAVSGESRDQFNELALYERHAGASQSWVRYTNIRNWWAVGPHAVVFEMDRSRHYLVRLIGACDLNLDTAISMRLINSRRNVLSEFDRVDIRGQTCQVQSVRRLDLDAVEAELAEQNQSLPEGQGRPAAEVAEA